MYFDLKNKNKDRDGDWLGIDFKIILRYSVLIINFSLQDRKGLENPKAVETIQDRLIEALKLQILRNHSTEENLFGTTIVKLPQLRTLGVQHDEILEWYRAQWNRVRLPPLFSEIYDISKHEEDVWHHVQLSRGDFHHFLFMFLKINFVLYFFLLEGLASV